MGKIRPTPSSSMGRGNSNLVKNGSKVMGGEGFYDSRHNNKVFIPCQIKDDITKTMSVGETDQNFSLLQKLVRKPKNSGLIDSLS